MNRGQISSTVFTYIFAIVVIAIILLLGYRYISGTQKNIEKADLILFKNKLTNDIETISQDFGSSKKVSYSVSAEELCLLDLGKSSEISSNPKMDSYPIIKDSVQSNVKKNAFVLGNKIFESYFVGNIEINDPFFKCFKPLSGKISFVIEGKGNRTLILS